MKSIIFVASLSVAASGFASVAPKSSTALDLSGRDPSVSACEDFYGHVNGLWEARTEIPANRARIGSFDVLRMNNDRLLEAALNELIDKPEQQNTPGLKLIAQAYRAAMDTKAIERNGLKPLQPLLKKIDALDSSAAIPALAGELSRYRVNAPFAFWVSPDTGDVRRHVVYAFQGGIGLPDREDYTKDDANSKRLLAAYRKHAANLLRLSSAPHDEKAIDALIAFEAKIAAAHMTPVQRRDPKATYNKFNVDALKTQAPSIDWVTYFSALLDEPKAKTAARDVIVSQPLLAKAFAELTKQASIEDWKRYLRVRLLDQYAPRLGGEFEQTHFDYRERAIRGLQSPAPRAERVVIDLGGATGGEPLGPALGELFVRKAFSPRAQARANEMIEDIRTAMAERIRTLDWMSEPTKKNALEKLAMMKAQIGAPAKPNDFSGLTLTSDDYAGNALAIAAWDMRVRAKRLDEPTDRDRWDTAAHIVNAFAGGQNRIVFPAGILQPPFFDENADDAVNFGGIGMVIGHEITHHFDDRGRQFDAIGQLKDWWTEADAKAYSERAKRVVNLYGAYEPLPGHFINGQQMLGENISDLGGMHIAYRGLQIALERKRAKGEKIAPVDGLTPEQRFFASNAIVWRGKTRTEALINQLRTGQHSPGPFRVRGPMSNMPEFAKAFACKAGDAMVSQPPVTIW
ncbi:MAG: M13 family metallopeptidase [Casimicrobium sp.]